MLVYVLVLIWLIFLIIFIKKRNIFLGIIPIFLLMVLKEPTGPDYNAYANHFTAAKDKTILEMASYKGEIGFHTLIKGLTLLTDNFQWLFVATSVIILVCIAIFFQKNSSDKQLALFFYFTLGIFAFTMAGLRQAVAMAICLFAYEEIKKKRFFRFMLVISIAFLFHQSAVFFIPAYFIGRMKWNIITSFMFVTFYMLSIFSIESIINLVNFNLGYGYEVEYSETGIIYFFILLGITLLSLLCRKQIIHANINNQIFINLQIFVLLLWSLRLLSRTVERPAFYYLFASVIILEQTISSIKDKKVRTVLYLSTILLAAVLFLYRAERDINLTPYYFIWG